MRRDLTSCVPVQTHVYPHSEPTTPHHPANHKLHSTQNEYGIKSGRAKRPEGLGKVLVCDTVKR